VGVRFFYEQIVFQREVHKRFVNYFNWKGAISQWASSGMHGSSSSRFPAAAGGHYGYKRAFILIRN
jgi:hypothetical protein